MDLSKLSMGDKIVAGAGLLLIIDLLFLPWHDIDLGIVSLTRRAIQSPNGFWGVLALLLTIALVAVVLLRKLSTAKLPNLPVPYRDAIFFAAVAVLVLLLLKLVMETDALGFGAWLGILLAAGLVYGAYTLRREPADTTM